MLSKIIPLECSTISYCFYFEQCARGNFKRYCLAPFSRPFLPHYFEHLLQVLQGLARSKGVVSETIQFTHRPLLIVPNRADTISPVYDYILYEQFCIEL